MVVISSMHYQGRVDTQSTNKKPEMVLFYNETKGAVDFIYFVLSPLHKCDKDYNKKNQ